MRRAEKEPVGVHIDEEAIDRIDAAEHFRLEDTIFTNILEMDENGEIDIGCYSGNSWTEGWEQIYSFPNEQHYTHSSAETEEDFIAGEVEAWGGWKQNHIVDGRYLNDDEVWEEQEEYRRKTEQVEKEMVNIPKEVAKELAERYMREGHDNSPLGISIRDGTITGRERDSWRVLRKGQERADFLFGDWNVRYWLAECNLRDQEQKAI